jgi:hypothetical protein
VTYNVVTALPEGLRDELPTPEQIARLMEGIE